MVVFWWAVVLWLFVGFWCLGCAIMGSFVWISCSWVYVVVCVVITFWRCWSCVFRWLLLSVVVLSEICAVSLFAGFV